jgi:NAD(P)H-dependent FMN reductase
VARARVPFRFLLISGSTRRGSTNTALVRTAHAVAPAEVVPTVFEGMTALPHFNPDEDADGAVLADGRPLDAAVRALRAAVAGAHAVLLCTPEYAGALPGSFKNLLDWCVGDAGMYDKPAAWINVSSSPTGAKDAHASLATVLRYLHADVVTPACAHIPVARHLVGADGLIADAEIAARIVQVLLALAAHVDTPVVERRRAD